jgi:glycosyltransferase involved in cell wall biosynthesis
MRVLHVCHWSLRNPDAETIRKLALTRELARLGHEVRLLAPDLGRPTREDLPRGARIVYAPSIGGRFAAHTYALTALPLLFLIALVWRPRAVYLTDHTASAPLALLLRLLGFRFVLEVNGIPLQDARLQGIEDGLWLRLIDLFSRTTYRLAERFVVVSPEIRENVERVAGGRPVQVIGNGVDLDLWRPERKDLARARLGLPVDRPVVGFLGSFYRWQGLDRLLLAAPLVLAKEPETLFLLAGFGPEEGALRELARPLGRSVLFPWKVPIEAGPTWVNAMDVGVHLVSPGKACSPVKLLCYMACARRCVATLGVDGFESVEKDQAGRRVDYSSLESIARGILGELEAARREDGSGPRGPAVLRHGWEGVARETEELLARL